MNKNFHVEPVGNGNPSVLSLALIFEPADPGGPGSLAQALR